MKKNNLTPEQEKIIDTLHNLVWHRITHDNKYLEAIPEINSRDFQEYIYYIRYDFLEYDDSELRAVLYLNGKHYVYTEAPQISDGIIWVNDIEDSEVESKIIELSGEIFEGFELYNAIQVLDKDVDERLKKMLHNNGHEYTDLPF
jgi:hypothetical protein